MKPHLKRSIRSAVLLSSLIGLMPQAQAQQGYQLVWSDEFTSGLGPDWVFDTGDGCQYGPQMCGWGNNEKEWYKAENATVRNGALVITMKREGNLITSAKLKTQGRKSWKYGRIEARIQFPKFQGSFPAFWMLGNEQPWPACGEIDVAEHVNLGTHAYGTMHWSGPDGKHAQYGGNYGDIDVSQYHTYRVDWDENAIKWYVDDVLYHEANIRDGINGTSEFHQPFYMILNLAAGGNWAGSTIDESKFPAEMKVDWVRVYQMGSTTRQPYGGQARPIPGRIEAEDYDIGGESITYHDTDPGNTGSAYRTDGVDLQACGEGGHNLGWVQPGEWVEYSTRVTPGTCTLKARVAATAEGGQFRVLLDGVACGTVDVPKTGGWQTWKTVTIENVPIHVTGEKILRIEILKGEFNLNWIEFSPATPPPQTQKPYHGTPWAIPGRIEAEAYDLGGEGIACHDTDGINTGSQFRNEGVDIGSNGEGGHSVGWTDPGEWLEYTVNVKPDTYHLKFRVASQLGKGRFKVSLDGITLGTVSVPQTTDWLSWQTVSLDQVALAGGQDKILRIDIEEGSFNLDAITFEAVAPPTTQQPYGGAPHPLPGRIEVEDYDLGGEGIAFHDTDVSNNGGSYRNDAVDIETCGEGGYNVGWLNGGEWLEYTTQVTAGPGTLKLRVAAQDAGARLRVLLEGQELGVLEIPATGGWQAWRTLTLDNLTLPSEGQKILRLEVLNGNVNVNWLEFAAATPPSQQQPYGGHPWSIPGRIEGENYDLGGEGIAYHDTEAANTGGAYRTEGVDLEACTEGGFDLGWTSPGEWMEYTTQVTPGTYRLKARVASANGGGSFRLLLDGVLLGSFEVPSTGGWQGWKTLTLDNVRIDGGQNQVLRVEITSGNFNLNWLEFSPSGGPVVIKPATSTTPFSLVVIPDSQFMVCSYLGGTPAMFEKQTQWVVDHLRDPNVNVAFVSHLGDITETGAVQWQWDIAKRAMFRFDRVVPYGLAAGNHDAVKMWERDFSMFNRNFPTSQYASQPWYGGNYPADRNENNYQLFDADGMEFIVIHLAWNPSADARAWASGILSEHAHRRAIISTHEYLLSDGTRSAIGQGIWNDVVRTHPNVFMVVCGHELGEKLLTSTNDAGLPVYQLLTDYQGENPQVGRLRYYTFKPGENLIVASSFATHTNQYKWNFNVAYRMR